MLVDKRIAVVCVVLKWIVMVDIPGFGKEVIKEDIGNYWSIAFVLWPQACNGVFKFKMAIGKAINFMM